MEEIKNEKCCGGDHHSEAKNCCGDKGCCACGHSKCLKIALKIVMILIILSIGICIGRHSNRMGYGFASERFNTRNGNFGGCPMLNGGRGDQNWTNNLAPTSTPTSTPKK